MNLPMHTYRSAPSTARVSPPPQTPKPHAYADKVAELVAQGHTHTSAMIHIERQQHGPRLPVSQPLLTGGKGIPRPGRATPTADRIMPHLTAEWQAIAPELCTAVGAKHDTVRMTMKRLVATGRVECKRGSGKTPSKWRLV